MFLYAVCLHAEVLQEITVKEGDTLWSVANYYLKDPQRWPEISKYNELPSSDLNVILPGMRLRIPILLIKEHLRSAHLIYLFNDVRYRKKNEAEWKTARLNMELFNEDGVRTLAQSIAKVKFASGELLQLDENSLIILKPENKREEIDLLSGGVRASKTKILASGSLIDPRIEPRGPNPDFKTKVKEDKTTLVEVYEGIVDVTAQGKTVTLNKGFGTEIKYSKPPSLPKALPPKPDMDAPSSTEMPGSALKMSGEQITSGQLRLDIKPVGPPASQQSSSAPQTQMLGQIINNYHIQISTTHTFTNIVLDEINPIKEKVTIDFTKYKLPDGLYYYRVSYLDDMGFEGQYSLPVQFLIDTTPPLLEISSPRNEEEVDTEFVHVEGTTEAWATLKINDKTAQVDEKGKFITALIPAKGKNLIAIEAVDRAGNVTKKEITVTKVKKTHGMKNQTGEIKEKSITFASIALGTLTAIVILGVLILIVK